MCDKPRASGRRPFCPSGTLIPILSPFVIWCSQPITRVRGTLDTEQTSTRVQVLHAACRNPSSAVKPHLFSASLPAFSCTDQENGSSSLSLWDRIITRVLAGSTLPALLNPSQVSALINGVTHQLTYLTINLLAE